MNIFILDTDPLMAARFHHDRHVIKMILEGAQILSTAWWLSHAAPLAGIYKSTHGNHPCSSWARKTTANYNWLWFLSYSLCKEYTYRYQKTHATEKVLEILRSPPPSLKKAPLTEFIQCMPDQYKRQSPVHAYRAYYIGEKVEGNKWTKRETPTWITSA